MNTHRIAIMTDSTCDLPQEKIEAHDICVVPLYVIWGDQQLRDGEDIQNEEFYSRIPDDPNHPSTSQPTPADFVRAIEECPGDEVVVICISSQLSGTVASANAAKSMVDKPIHVVDSLSVSMGLGWQVLAAARARDAGASAEEILKAVEEVRETLQVIFTVETLEYLHRGGRIGSAAKLLGTALQLKPLLTIRTDEGTVDALERVRSRKRSLKRVVEYTLEQMDTSRPMRMGVMHGAAPQDAQAIIDDIRSRVQPAELFIADVGPVLGTHGGPGVIGIGAYYE